MIRSLAFTGLIAGSLSVAACVPSPRAFETAPVEISTSKGVVTCQLYTREIVAWDRAIDRPGSMSVEEADNICLEEGKRRKSGTPAS